MRYSIGVVALCLSLCSCQSVGLYAKRRAQDLSDCFAFVVAPGTAHPISIAAGVEITSEGPLGLGDSRGDSYGFVGRNWGAHRFGVVNPSLFLLVIEELLEPPSEFLGQTEEEQRLFERSLATVQHRPSKPLGRNPDRFFRIGAHAGFSVFFIYADVELGEIVDFALGIFGIDIMNDDVPADSADAAIH